MCYKKVIAEIIKESIEIEIEEIEEFIEIPPSSEMGDYTLPCYKLSKLLGKNPNLISEELKNKMRMDHLSRIESLGPYLNFYIDKTNFIKVVIDKILREKDNYGRVQIGKGKNVIIDNFFYCKEEYFDLDKLQSEIVTEALYKMFSFAGYNSIKLCCKFMNNHFPTQQEGTIREIERKGFLRNINAVEAVMLKEYNLPPFIVKKNDGNITNSAMQLCNIIKNKQSSDFYKYICIADMNKKLNFNQAVSVLKLMGHKFGEDCYFAGFSLARFFRKGLMLQRCSFEFSKLLEKEIMKKNLYTIEDKNMNNKEELAGNMAENIIKFTYLKNSSEKDIVIDIQDILDPNGETLLFVEQIYKKGINVLKKCICDYAVEDCSILGLEELRLAKMLEAFPGKVILAIEKLEPYIITKHVIEIAKALNQIYNKYYIVDEENIFIIAAVAIIEASCQVIESGLLLLGINVI